MLIAAGLVAGTLFVYHRVIDFDFVNLDDNLHVYQNEFVRDGFSLRSLKWAFGIHGPSQWHPLTWMSHQLDCELFGLDAGRHHLMNVALHAANAVLLFLLLKLMTAAALPSAFAAALFALHTLNVESVVWISDRKNLLCTFLGLLTMLAYVAYARRRGRLRYLAVVVLFGLTLMAKPMLVTLPCLLLLLDVWPLQRLRLFAWKGAGPAGGVPPAPRASIGLALLEKAPLLALSAGAIVLTLLCHAADHAVLPPEPVSPSVHASKAAAAYVWYLQKLIWPAGLSLCGDVFPSVGVDGVGRLLRTGVIHALLLAIVTVAVLYYFRKRPYLAVGWFWYVGVLFPVISLIHVETQPMADRYSYVPAIGLFIALAWLARDLIPSRPRWQAAGWAAAVSLLIPAAIASRNQTLHWRNSVTLFKHALAVSGPDHVAHLNLGAALRDLGRLKQAETQFRRALDLDPQDEIAHYDLAVVLHDRNRLDQAIRHYRRAIELEPEFGPAHQNLANALLVKGDRRQSIVHSRRAIQILPDNAVPYNCLAAALISMGEIEEALEHYRAALRLRPDWAMPASNLACVLATIDDPALRNGAEAVHFAECASQLSGGRDPVILNNLSAAYAATGRFRDALLTAKHAFELAADSQPALASGIRVRMQLYSRRRPVRQSFAPAGRR